MTSRALKSRRINVSQLRRFLASDDAINLTEEQRSFLIWRAQERNQRARYETAAWRRAGAQILRELKVPQISRQQIAAIRRIARKMSQTVIPARKVDMLMDLRRTLAVANSDAAYARQQAPNNLRKNTARDKEISVMWAKYKSMGWGQPRALKAINKKLGSTFKLTRFRQIIKASVSAIK
jgi:hypothetical protein